jgi:acetyl-CoA synthetase
MSDTKIYPVPEDWASTAYVNRAQYEEMYRQSIENPDEFWRHHGYRIDWIKPYSKVKDTSYDPHNVDIRWYEDGTLNVCANCVDRHLETRGDQVAILWEGDEPDMDLKITYRQLHERVCRFANVLKNLGVKKGDRVTIYLPMIPEAAYAMLACARIGAIHSVVFGGFSPDALAGRINDCDSNLVITADEGVRGGRTIPLKANTDKALAHAPGVQNVLVVKRTNADVPWTEGRDVWLQDEMEHVSADCPDRKSTRLNSVT